MPNAERFPYLSVAAGAVGQTVLVPRLPLRLERAGRLVDSGAAISVLPHSVGLALGAVWEEQTIPLVLGGNLESWEARALLVYAVVGSFSPVQLAFAWTRTDMAPLLLGQTNFFAEFAVCFFRSQAAFEISQKQVPAV